MNFIQAAFLRGFKPRPKVSGSQWADRFRYVASGTSPEPGEWRTSRTPYLREPMDAATDKRTEMVVMMFSSQVGKSEALLNIMGYYVDQEPSPQLMLQPTVEMAEAFSKERIDPMFRASPGLSGKLEDGKDGRGTSRKSSTTIRMKQFPGGYLALVGANSPAGLASRPIRVLLCDEVDRYGTTKEGDPLKLAIQRTQNFSNRKIVLVSTPTINGISRINDYFERSDQRYYFVPCPHCGEEIVLDWDCVKWDKDEEGNSLPETAAMFCPKCGAKIRGAFKPDIKMLQDGRWKATNPHSKIKGYHINALYSPWVNLCDLVEEFVTVTHNSDSHGLMEFVNLKLGEPWEERRQNEGLWEHLHMRREYYVDDEKLPEGVLILTAGVDVQRDRLECTIIGWGIGREAWGIEHRVIYGSPEEPSTWELLDGVLQRQYVMHNDVNVQIACTFIDSGDGMYTNMVYQYTRAREALRIFSIKGRGGFDVPFVGLGSKNNPYKATLFILGVDSGKSLVMDSLTKDDEGPGFVHFPMQGERGFDEHYFKMLTAEVLEQKRERGTVKMSWVKIRERNEALDCFVYARAGIELLNPDFEYWQEYYAKGGAKTLPKRKRGVISKGVSIY